MKFYCKYLLCDKVAKKKMDIASSCWLLQFAGILIAIKAY
jgi:hypothetical protein